MKSLFGHLCPVSASFSHDNEMLSREDCHLSRAANPKSSMVSSDVFLEKSMLPSASLENPSKTAISVGKFEVPSSDSHTRYSSIGYSNCSGKIGRQMPAFIEVSTHNNSASNRTFSIDGLPYERTLNNIRRTFNEWLGNCNNIATPLQLTANIEHLPCNEVNSLPMSTTKYGSNCKITCPKELGISEGKFCCECAGCHARFNEQVQLGQHMSDFHDQKYEGFMPEYEFLETPLKHILPRYPKCPKTDHANYPNTCSIRQNGAKLLGKRTTSTPARMRPSLTVKHFAVFQCWRTSKRQGSRIQKPSSRYPIPRSNHKNLYILAWTRGSCKTESKHTKQLGS